MAETPAELEGRDVLSVREEKIGKIDQLYTEGDDDEPKWARLKLGVLGLHSALIPLHDAQDEDGQLRIVYEKDHVRDAPSVEPDGDHLDEEDADLLRRYYGLERVSGLTAPGGDDDDIELSRETREAEPPGLKEGPDSPLTKRRRQRAEELGVPSASEDGEAPQDAANVESGELDVSEQTTPTAKLPDDDEDEGEGKDEQTGQEEDEGEGASRPTSSSEASG
jgi:hypothetical protein